VPPSSAVQHLAVQGGKDGLLRLLNLQDLSGKGGPGNVSGEIGSIISLPQGGGLFGQPAVWVNPADGSTWIIIVNGNGASGLRLNFDGSGNPSLSTQWQNGQSGTSPILAHNIVFLIAGSNVRALDPVSGNQLWSAAAGGNAHWQSVIVANGNVYATDQANHVAAFGLSQGPPPSSTALSSSANPSLVGSSVTFAATVNGLAPTGSVAFKDGGNAISGCSAVTLPAGSANAKVATCSTSSLSAATHSIVATYAGDAGNNGSTSSTLAQVVNSSGGGTDVIWVDDSIPAGAIADGDEAWAWVSSNPTPFSGTKAHQSALRSSAHQHYFYNATATLSVGIGDSLFTYVYLDPVNPPSEVMLQWYDGTSWNRAYWGANQIALGTNGTASLRFMGALPPTGQWVRLSVPAAQVGMEGRILTGMAFTLVDGKATWDRAGKTSAGSLTSTSTTLSSSANPSTVGASVTFTATVNGTAPTGAVAFTDSGSAIAGCSAVALPAGSANAKVATCSTSSLSAATHSIVATYAGDAGNNGSTSPTLAQVVNSGGGGTDVIWVDDSIPAGAIADGDEAWAWVSSNPTPFSGTKAHQSALRSSAHQHYFYNATATLSVGIGDSLFTYVYLDPVNPPSEVMLQWYDGTSWNRAYWGANQIALGTNGTASLRFMGALPPTGQWVRLSVPAAQVGMEGRILTGMAFTLVDGKATWDRAGKTSAGSLTSTSTTLSSSANPSTVGASVTFTATVNGTAPTGAVAFTDSGSAIAGCSAVALPAGSANAKVATCSTSSLSAATHSIVATYAGDAGNNGSTSPTLAQVVNSGGGGTDVIWVDDSIPAGAIADGDEAWAWVSSNPTPFSGTKAHQSALRSSAHQHYFYNATATLSVGIGDSLFTYVYLDPVNPPSEVMLQWYDGTSWNRAYWGANQIALGTNGTASLRFMGALPPTGQWVRLSVPAAQVGMEGRILTGMAFTLVDGKATWDRAGKTSAGSLTSTSTTLSSSANPSTVGASVTFTATVNGTAPTGAVAFTDSGSAIAGCSAVALPAGSANAKVATCSTSSLSAATHSIVATYAGDAGNNGSTSPTLAQVVNSGGGGTDVIWVDDSIPAGAIADGDEAWAWVSSNPTPFSGTKAHQSALRSSAHQHYFYNATATLSVGIGDSLFTYVYLDPVNPPSEVMLQWYDGTSWNRAYWGANQIALGTNGTASLRFMGALPPTGQWVRLSVPAAQVGMEGRILTGMAFTLVDGKATWDRAGKTSAGSLTSTSTTLSSSANPSTVGASVTFTATVNGTAPTGAVAFTDSGSAIAGCSAVALPAGSANAKVATCSTSSLSAATHSIVATYAGDAGNNGSTSPTLAQVVNSGGGGTDVIWVDDSIPAGAIADGDEAWAWVSSNPTPFSGTKAHQSALRSSAHQHYFYNATATLSVGIGDSLFTYVYLDPVNPPSEVMLQWYDGTSWNRAYWGANQIALGTNGTASLRFMGALPPTGQWVRLSVPAAQVGMEGRILTGMAFTLVDGKATWDRAGKTSAGSLTSTSTTLSSSANPSTVGASVTFTATVNGTAPTGAVAFTDSGSAIAGCSAVALPAGSANAKVATCSTSSLSAATHSIVATYAGDAGNNGSTSPTLAQVVNSGGGGTDVIWVDDSIPAGAIADGDEAWAWVSSNPTPFSGTKAHQSALRSSAHQHYFYNATATLSVGIGDSLFTYVYLDPVNPPSEVMLQWYDGTSWNRAYWGANQIALGTNGTASLRFMGALPPTGQWVRLSVPAAQVGMEGHVLTGMAFALFGGKATWDRAGKHTGP
jgi:hypothetical protein